MRSPVKLLPRRGWCVNQLSIIDFEECYLKSNHRKDWAQRRRVVACFNSRDTERFMGTTLFHMKGEHGVNTY